MRDSRPRLTNTATQQPLVKKNILRIKYLSGISKIKSSKFLCCTGAQSEKQLWVSGTLNSRHCEEVYHRVYFIETEDHKSRYVVELERIHQDEKSA